MPYKPYSRRAFLRGLAIGAAAFPLLRSAELLAADTPARLAESDEAAKALGYIEDAAKLDAARETNFKKGSTCANCMLYQNAQEKDGFAPCTAFPGKSVSANGWCRVWAAKT